MSKQRERWQNPSVVFQPQVYTAMQAGVRQIVNAIRPTLGPFPRLVLYDTTLGSTGRLPELLDDGGTIARRIIQIRGRDEDVGAMLARHMLWRQRENVGDGTATAAVIFETAFDEGIRYVAAGGNPMRLRGYLERGMRVILDELAGMTFHLEGKAALGDLATSICYDAELGAMLGEIFEIIGEYGRLEIRGGRGRQLEREYVEGMYWSGGLLSRKMINTPERGRAELENPAILLTDQAIKDPRELIPVFAAVIKAQTEGLVLVVRKLSEGALAMILANQKQQRLKVEIVAVKTPGTANTDQRDALIDLSVLTGGHPFLRAAGETLERIRPQDLGYARRVWADKDHVGIIGGRSDPRELREHLAGLRRTYANLEDPDDRKKLQARIGKLMGGSATLWVGGNTKTELEYNKELARRTADAMRGAMREGVVPGGGAALLDCRPALQERLEQSTDVDARAAYRILLRAVEAPTRTLLQNAGLEPGAVMGEIDAAGPGHGYDIQQGEVVNMVEVGILDAVTAVKAAARNAISTAALALTTDVVIHRKNPPEAMHT
jgi:chaperonin GroEL